MAAIRINPVVVSVSPTNTAQLNRVQPTMHGGGVKKVVAVVAAVAIPIAAPAIASSIAASGVLGAAVSAAAATTAGAVVGSAIVGAGLGAITAKVTGGNVKAGAIGGFIGGGIGGFGVARSTGAGLGNVNQTGIQATSNRVLGTNFGGQAATPATPTAADGTLQQAGLNTGDAGATLSNTTPGTETLVNADGTTLVNATTAPTTGTDVAAQLSNTGGPQVQNAVVQTGGTTATAGATEAAKAPFTERFMNAVKGIPGGVADRITDPDALANLTMQAGGQLLGQALAPDPEMPPEQRQLLEERKAELAELKSRDEEAFNAQMDAAKQYLQQAQQFDPTYMAFQSANKAAIENQRKLREQYRRSALSRGRDISPAEQRRMELDAARNVSSQYDAGFMQGMNAQNRATQAGLSAIPNSANFATYTNALQNLSSDVASAENRARTQSATAAKNISDLFAGFNTKASNTQEAEEAMSGLDDGLDQNNNNNRRPPAGLQMASFGSNAGFGNIA